MRFFVIDKSTGEPPDLLKLQKEKWTESINFDSIAGWFLGENFTLRLQDEEGGSVIAPYGRFEIEIMGVCSTMKIRDIN